MMREKELKYSNGGKSVMQTRAWSILFLAVLILTGAASAGAQTPPPAIFFSDLQSGPNSGGDSQSGFSGAYVTLYGNNFGVTQGTSSVTMNGSNCLRVVQWGATWLWYQKIVVQLGPSCTTGNFVVTVAAQASNATPFTVRTGNIYCISATGSDSNTGKFPASCWATMAHAASSMVAGDTVYLENGVKNTGISAFSATVNIETSGTAASPIAFVAYPGATATIGDINNSPYGIRVPNIGVAPNYIVIAGLSVRGNEAMDAPSGNDHWWMVGNDFSCSGASGFGCVHVDQSTNVFTYGNNLHDNGYNCPSNSGNPTGAACKFHGFYYTTNTNHVWVGWNVVNPNPNKATNAGCNGIQFYSTGGADQFDLHLHVNLIENVVCDGLTFSTVSASAGAVEAYNNVFLHDGTGPDPSGSASGYACVNIWSITSPTAPVKVYNNSFFDCGSRGNVDNSNAVIRTGNLVSLVNNSMQVTGSGEQYIAFNSGGCTQVSGNHNDWFGNGGIPCASQLAGDMNVNPQYTSTTSGSWNLLPLGGSPLIGAGTSSLITTLDINGLIRPSPPSIGGYEFATGVAVQKPNPPTNLTVVVQ
jgi:hypothetical protein